jgi:uncharacterized membrane protein (DUF2068 family)
MVGSRAVRAAALFEAAKGLLVLVAATGLLSLFHSDLHAFAAKLVEHTHLNPASKYPRIFLDAASQLQNSHLLWLAFGAAGYSAVRFVEAYGLYNERAWAEVLAAGSGAVYVPFEVEQLLRAPTAHGAILLVLNLAVVAVMLQALLVRRRAAQGGDAA